MFYTYILRCADNSYYTGHTDDLHRRIDQHQTGVVRGYTYERHYRMRSEIAGRYISIVRVDYGETGGSHPNSDLDTIIWDQQAGKRISIRPFFADTADGSAALKAMRAASRGCGSGQCRADGRQSGSLRPNRSRGRR